jgi:hypothetical protein
MIAESANGTYVWEREKHLSFINNYTA